MAIFFSSLLKEKYDPDETSTAEYGNLHDIRNDIVNSIYLLSGIFGTFATYGTLVRVLKFGWQPFFVFNFFLYGAVWTLYFLRHKISLNWKASLFFILFFILASFINYTSGVISGPLNFVFISTLVTLIFGWKAGVISIILTLLVRTTIGLGYLKGILHYKIDLATYANSEAAMVTTIMSGLVIASITVFAINKFNKWLIVSLKTVSVKANELTLMNAELLSAKQIAEEHDHLKSVFLANMSHEIRTPMNAIMGFSSLLSKPDISDNQRFKYTGLIQERSTDLMHIIEDILDVSKIEVGQMKLFDLEFDLLPIMLDLQALYKVKKDKSPELNITCNTADDIKHLRINLDQHRLKQILTNLLDNACKFTSKGSVEFGCKMQPNSELLFWVKDTGIGIPKNKQTVIFDRFRQVDDSITSRQYGGAGLGLSIVQGLIKLMNGQIWLESEVGQGSSFYFSIPVSRLNEVAKTVEITPSPITLLDRPKTILIVEDDLLNAEYLREVFSDTKLNIILAYTGEDALKAIKGDQKIDLILMDIRLPDINGIQLTKLIKKDWPEIVVIAQTAYSGSQFIKEFEDAGCNDFITKPIDQDQLLSLTSKYLGFTPIPPSNLHSL